ncbi:Acyltransferase [Hyphomicrobiales bacterium]|nr:Acyltransferase [Hyphomicrobiales bacterium]CAH1699593.1 Acyltransferase [Hyphomicrobiales bacterium]CAI0344560.1 exopolysaccharide production protein ExoZ [Hyphomicrobiales bacterium]
MRHTPRALLPAASQEPFPGSPVVPPAQGGAFALRNVRLQYLRAAAALSVLLYHASVIVERINGNSGFLSIFGGFWGAYGVAVFFALSGYLMGELIQRDDPARFMVNRLARIYPPMLLAVAIFWVAFFAAGFLRSIDPIGLLLAPAGSRDYFLAVEWTLVYEMSYYVILALLGFAGLRRFASWLAAGWIAVILIMLAKDGLVRDDTLPLLSELPLQAINLPFLIGFLLPDLARRGWLPPGLWLVAIPTTLAGAYLIPGDPRMTAVFPAILIVAAAVRTPKPAPETRLGKVGERLGDASYMLYLCHMPLMTLFGGFAPAFMHSLALWFGGIGASIAFSLALAPADLGMHRWFKARIAAAPASRLRALALGFIAIFIGVAAYAEIDERGKRAAYAQAVEVVTSGKPVVSPTIRAEIDSVDRLPDGTLVVRGYAVDLDRPKLASHAAILRNGSVVVMERSRRMRADKAQAWSRPDLAGVRFGFVLMLPKNAACAAGAFELRVALEDGRLVVPTLAPAVSLCQ